MSNEHRCSQCGEPFDEDGMCINRRIHETDAMRKEHARQLEDANDVIVDLFHAAKSKAAVWPECETLLRSLLRASEYLRDKGVRR